MATLTQVKKQLRHPISRNHGARDVGAAVSGRHELTADPAGVTSSPRYS